MSRGRRLLAVLAVIVVAAGGYWVWHRIQTAPIKAADIMPTVSQPAAQKAVVTSTDMPDDEWKPSTSDDDDESRSTYAPKACATLGERPAAKAQLASSSYERGGSLAAALVETIYRPAGRTPAAEVAQLRSLVSQCSTYRYRQDGTKGYTVSVAPLVVTKHATDTLGVRSSIAGSMTSVSDSIIWVAAGDVVVRFDSITAGDGMTQKDLEKLVRTSLVRLKK